MTDSKQRLRALDRLETPDVWDRALTLQPTAEIDESVEHSTRKRVVVIMVAFAVFAAAAAFAWQGFRSSTPSPAGPPDVISSTVLWPERTQSALLAAQASADAGDAGSAWRLDPAQVAARFAKDVLRWGGVPDGAYRVEAGDVSEAGSVVVSLSRVLPPCPSPAPGTASTCPPPFESETLTMRQEATNGPTGVWSITEVRAADLAMKLAAGAQVPNGTNIPGEVTLPATASSVPGFSVVSGETIGYRPGCGETGGGPINEGTGTVASVQVQPADMVDCGTSADGYVWIATEAGAPDQGAVVADPLQVTPSYLRFYGLTIVPMQVSLPENGSPTVPTPSATTQESLKRMGIPIVVDYPQAWSAQPVSVTLSSGGGPLVQTVGLAVSNSSQGMPSPGAASPSAGPPPGNPDLPRDYVTVTILETQGGAPPPPGPDTPLPLSLTNASSGSGTSFLLLGGVIGAKIAGSFLTITVSSGPDASPADIQAAVDIVASIRPGGASASP